MLKMPTYLIATLDMAKTNLFLNYRLLSYTFFLNLEYAGEICCKNIYCFLFGVFNSKRS